MKGEDAVQIGPHIAGGGLRSTILEKAIC